MNRRDIATLGLALLAFTGSAVGQTQHNKQLSPSYVESCTQNQVQMHQKVKGISADQFRSFCECISQELMKNLSSTQLDELNKNSQKPGWLKTAEDTASKSCLKIGPKTQA